KHLFYRLERGRQPPFIRSKKTHPVFLKHQVRRSAIDISGRDQAFVDALCRHRNDQDILNRHLLSGMLASAEEVNHETRQGANWRIEHIRKMLIKGDMPI